MTSRGRSISLSSRLTTAALAIAVMVGAASLVHCDSSLPRDINYDSGVGAEFTPPQPKADANVDGSQDASDAQMAGTGGSAGATGTGGSSGSGGLPATGGVPATGGGAVAGAAGSGGEGGGAGGAGGDASGGAAGG